MSLGEWKKRCLKSHAREVACPVRMHDAAGPFTYATPSTAHLMAYNGGIRAFWAAPRFLCMQQISCVRYSYDPVRAQKWDTVSRALAHSILLCQSVYIDRRAVLTLWLTLPIWRDTKTMKSIVRQINSWVKRLSSRLCIESTMCDSCRACDIRP